MAYKPGIYNTAGLYDQKLPPYLFDVHSDGNLSPDEEVLDTWLHNTYGEPTGQLNILEIGAGTGRMTEKLLPYAGSIVCTDKYASMLDDLNVKYPHVETIAVDTQDLSKTIKPENQYDLVSGFWTLSYPIGAYLETIDSEKIIPRPDFENGVHEAEAMVSGLARYLKDSGRFVTYFFDSESPEQQAVTKIWEQLAPDPGGYRGFTRDLAIRGLKKGAAETGKVYSQEHFTGIAPFESPETMVDWYRQCHSKGLPTLTETALFTTETTQLTNAYTTSEGHVELPVGMYALHIEPSN